MAALSEEVETLKEHNLRIETELIELRAGNEAFRHQASCSLILHPGCATNSLHTEYYSKGQLTGWQPMPCLGRSCGSFWQPVKIIPYPSIMHPQALQ